MLATADDGRRHRLEVAENCAVTRLQADQPRLSGDCVLAETGEDDSGRALIDEAKHRAGFRKVRAARRTELAEDYIELIDDLLAHHGEARQVEIAARLGVTQPTVAKMLRRLAEDGLVESRRYRGVFLTDAGRAMADRARSRHEIVEQFLIALGVDPDIAQIDSEGMEHHVSEETLAAMRRFLGR